MTPPTVNAAAPTPSSPPPPVAAAPVRDRVRTPWSEFWRKFKKQPVAMGALIFVALLVLVAIFAPFIVPYDPENFFGSPPLSTRHCESQARAMPPTTAQPGQPPPMAASIVSLSRKPGSASTKRRTLSGWRPV